MSPLQFTSWFRPQVWGGRRLQAVLGKPLPPEGRFGEAWDLSSQPLHISRVAAGPLAGQTLAELWSRLAPEWRGADAVSGQPFPLLVKWLDCHDQLSVQVHPDDAAAGRLLGDRCGKTEAWVVIHAEPDARIYAGLQPGVDASLLCAAIDDGTVARHLHAFQPQRGDVVFIPAGTVHAAGGGIVMAEIQQTSDATFRLYDWQRPGPDGQPRPLHLREALACIDWSRGPVDPVARLDLDAPADAEPQTLLECPYFAFRAVRLRSRAQRLSGEGVSILMTLAGAAEVESAAGAVALPLGATCLLPPSPDGWSVRPIDPAGATLLQTPIV
ncbi:MAG: class I mannose-6-phosphate isomerase [Planctomyces sp.]|nr:class I mannose-6-phosphate isomerase [Planctomyces sp.]